VEENRNQRSGVGEVLVALGFVALVAAVLTILGVLVTVTLMTDFLAFLGLALIIVGFGLVGSQWAKKSEGKTIKIGPQWSVIITIVATVIITFMAIWAYIVSNAIWAATSVGALGGLVHEISQSKGTAFLPTETDTQDAGKAGKSQESYLGGLVGIILGGAAGLLTLSAASATSAAVVTVNTQFAVAAFAAGVAFKGISDAAASPPRSTSTTTTTTPTPTSTT